MAKEPQNTALQKLAEPSIKYDILCALKKGISIKTLSETYSVSVEFAKLFLRSLEDEGYLLQRNASIYKLGKQAKIRERTLNLLKHFKTGPTVIGFVTDTHLASKHERLDILETAYEIYSSRGISIVLHAGNLVDGEKDINRHELIVAGIAGQCDYVLENYPSRKGITTYFIDGDDHEGWWKKQVGIEFGQFLHLRAQECGRKDLQYLGYSERDVYFGKTRVKLIHPGGGTAYAISYKSQKIVNALSPGDKPNILLVGHTHKVDYSCPRGVHVVQGGCTQDQTTFMRKNSLEAHLNFCVLSWEADRNGCVTRFVPEFYQFYDRFYYENRDGKAKKL